LSQEKGDGVLGAIAIAAGAVLGLVLYRSLQPLDRATIGAFGIVRIVFSMGAIALGYLASVNGMALAAEFAVLGLGLGAISLIMVVHWVRGFDSHD